MPSRNLRIKYLNLFVIWILVFGIFALVLAAKAFAQDCGTDLDCQIRQIQKEIDALAPAQENNKKELAGLNSQLADLQARITALSSELNKVQKDIAKREEDTAYAQEILNNKAVDQYKSSRLYSPVFSILSAPDATDAFRLIKLMGIVADGDRKTIEKYAQELFDLKKDKDSLEKNKASLAVVQAKVNERAKFLGSEVAKVDAYISDLSAKQQELIALKSGNFSVSVGDAALADDYNASLAGWQANAPSGSVTVFSFGAYAGNGANYQRNGMSQYGAWTRAKSNQSYNDILQAYYGTTSIPRDMPSTINTNQGTMPFETQYLYGIAEMPSSWTDNDKAALKAQAIAARTFAYHYIQRGQTICTDDHCQVYRASKVGDPSARPWRDAVDQTKGLILPDGVSAQYVSTPGGYLDTKGWDTTCGNQGCLAGGAWDAASPWFYKAWYTNYKYSSGFSTCQRSNPWLSQDDIADILNAWVVYTNGTSDDKSHIFPPDGCGGGSPYSKSDMTSRANSLGGAYTSVSSVNVSQSTGGYTSSITFQTNKGPTSITGFDTECAHTDKNISCRDFWTIFNLRASGNISIKSRMFDLKVK